MLTAADILKTLEECRQRKDYMGVEFSGPDAFFIDARANIFRNDRGQWAAAFEVLAYDSVSHTLTLQLTFFGNCLLQKNSINDYKDLHPVDDDNFSETTTGHYLSKDAAYWLVKGVKLPLSHNRQDYARVGIVLQDAMDISIVEAARLLAEKYSYLFMANDDELHRYIPASLSKVMVLDEWRHHDEHHYRVSRIKRDGSVHFIGVIGEDDGENGVTIGRLEDLFFCNETVRIIWNKEVVKQHLPGNYETWPMLAQVMATGNVAHYCPRLPPNTHWSYWQHAGCGSRVLCVC